MQGYHRAIPARGTHPGAFTDTGNVWEHDPRGYHPDWQTGWQTGYTDGYSSHGQVGSPSARPSGVLDDRQFLDGYGHGRNVAVYHWHLTRTGRGDTPGVPSPWWRKPDAEAPDGYQTWVVAIRAEAQAATPRDAGLAAWDGISTDDAGPPVVDVWPVTGSPADAVTVDLATDPHEEDV